MHWSKTMRSLRSIKDRGRKKGKAKIIDLDITSLLDVLVIMLVFLLVNFNSSDVVINIPKGVKLPSSDSQSVNEAGVIVQVSPTNIWVDDQLVLDINDKFKTAFDQGGRRIVPLYDELVKKKELIKQVQKTSKDAVPFSGKVNLVVDKTLKYSFIKKIMYTCAEAGYKQYKFVVLANETL